MVGNAIGAGVTWLCFCGIGTAVVMPLLYALVKLRPEHPQTPFAVVLLFIAVVAVVPTIMTLFWWNDVREYGRFGG